MAVQNRRRADSFWWQVPALKQALKQGVNYDYIASGALKCLEEWVDDSEPCLQGYLCEILPLLELYFRQQDEGTSLRKGAMSSDKKVSKYKYQMKKKSGYRTRSSTSQNDAKNLALRAVRLLGKLGTDERWLAEAAEEEAFDRYGLDTSHGLLPLKDLQFGNSDDCKPSKTINLDCLLPRVMFLAEKSAERQTKVASCELLHALVTTAIGSHSVDSENAGNYTNLFSKVFPCVFRLAVDGEPISNQIFQPLIMQLIHWYTTKEEAAYQNIASELLDAILGGLESHEDGKLREASSKFLAEFVKWTLKGTKDAKEKEQAQTVKKMFYRIYGLLSHPSAPKRLGAYLAVKQVIVWACECDSVYTCTYVCTHVSFHAYVIYDFINMCVCVCVCVYSNMHIYIYI